jgi:hypothetical protein
VQAFFGDLGSAMEQADEFKSVLSWARLARLPRDFLLIILSAIAVFWVKIRQHRVEKPSKALLVEKMKFSNRGYH